MSSSRYFFALFGDPKPPEKDTVESGIYHPHPKSEFRTEPGHILLLYCSGGYPGYEYRVPGIGIVLSTKDEAIHYRYLPFVEPIPKNRIDQNFEPSDLEKFKNKRFWHFWLFEISTESFAKTVGPQEISWPR